jgi:YVTN family beta-propeller protein
MSVSVIDGGTNKVIKTLSVGKSPEGIAVDPNKGTIFVANSGSYSVSILEGSADYFQILAKVNLVSENFTNLPQVYNLATYIAVNPETNKAYVTNEDADVVSVLNINYSTLKHFGSVTEANQHKILVTGKIVPSQIRQPGTTLPGILVGNAPHGIAVDYSTNLIYVTNQESDSISVIDGTTRSLVNRNIPVGTFPHVVAVNPITNKIYVTNWGTIDINSSTVSVIDGRTNRVIAQVPTGNSPHSVVINPKTNLAYVSNEDDNTVSVIDGSTYKVLKTIKVGKSPEEAAINTRTNLIYFTNADDNTVSVIDGSTYKVLKTIKVGNSPADIAVNEASNLIYVANQDDDTVSVINGSKALGTIIGTISSGSQPHGEAYNQCTNKLYVSNVGSNTVTVLNATTQSPIGTVLIGDPNLADDFDFASHIAVNPNDNLVYVTSQDANAITIINGTTNRVIGQN